MTKEFLEKLFQLIKERAAEAQFKNQICCESDYDGMDEWTARHNAETLEKELIAHVESNQS